jgi:hypothetical protein
VKSLSRRREESPPIKYAGYFDVPESHSGILDRRITTTAVSIYGLGHLGSWIARALVALGVRDMALHDFDIIEERNLSGSVYNRKHVGLKKTNALVDILRGDSLVSADDTRRGIVGHDNTLGYAFGTKGIGFVYQPFVDFYILATDNPESRIAIAKTIFEQWRMCGHANVFSQVTPVLIDTRSAGATFTVMNVPIRDVEMQKRYMLDLEELARGTGHINCDEANIIQVPLFVSSIVAQMVTSFARGKEAYFVYHGSLIDLGRWPFRTELEKFLPKLES